MTKQGTPRKTQENQVPIPFTSSLQAAGSPALVITIGKDGASTVRNLADSVPPRWRLIGQS